MALRLDLPLTAVPALQPAAEAAARLRVCMMVTYDLASPGGGVKHHAQQLAAALRRNGDHVTIVGPSSAPIKDEDTATFSGVVNIPANGSDNMLGIFASPWAIAKYFRENRFDVVHVHEPMQPSLSYWSTWLTRHVPHVATFHAFAEQESRGFLLARRFWAKTLFPYFQRGIAVSEPAARYASVTWKKPLAIIPNGVPTDIFTPPEHAYRGLLANRLPVTLDVVGELGEAEPPPELPGLRYHGPVGFDRLTELYRDCDVFVAPSTGQESFGIVLLEAMSSAKPVVCSDIEGYRQVAIPEGSYLVPPNDANALAERLAHVIKLDPATRRRQGELNRRAAEHYDWDRLAERVRHEYTAAIAALGAPRGAG